MRFKVCLKSIFFGGFKFSDLLECFYKSVIFLGRGGGSVGYSLHLSFGRLGVRIPVETDLSRKNG